LINLNLNHGTSHAPILPSVAEPFQTVLVTDGVGVGAGRGYRPDAGLGGKAIGW
jgi:hypothetical protein